MKLLLIIPALVSGFIYSHFYLEEYYRLHRYRGPYLNLRSTVIGCFFTTFTSILYLILHRYVPSEITICEISIPIPFTSFIESILNPVFTENSREAAFVLVVFILSPLSALLIAKYLNKKIKLICDNDTDAIEMYYRYSSQTGHVDRLLADAFLDRSSLLFTLSSGKLYVGDIIKAPTLPNESEKQTEEITITPIMSGYRTKKRHKAKFITDYDLSNISEDIQQEDLTVIFNKKDVATVSYFDIDLYRHLNPIKPTKPKIAKPKPSFLSRLHNKL